MTGVRNVTVGCQRFLLLGRLAIVLSRLLHIGVGRAWGWSGGCRWRCLSCYDPISRAIPEVCFNWSYPRGR